MIIIHEFGMESTRCVSFGDDAATASVRRPERAQLFVAGALPGSTDA